MYKKTAFIRCDDTGKAYYFSADDFPGLHREACPFTASGGHTLQGYLYSYDSPRPGRLVVFDHGFFGGHRSYMKEIELLCRRGFAVFAYDHTGCMESGGENTGGMTQSLCDLNDCICMLRRDSRFQDAAIAVVGHSWGGFAAANISAFHPDLSHVVVLSGFVSVQRLVDGFFSGLMKLYRPAVMRLERQCNPRFVDCDAVTSLSQTQARILLIYSEDDKMCRKDPHFDLLQAGLSHRENVEFVLVSGKGHNPNYTADAVRYLAEYSAAQNRLSGEKKLETAEQKAEFIASFDWNRMTAQDDAVWAKIFACLES